ncbi:hypothetical protein BV22DRAFT_76901 [Leucogyrophana mollusca]|uniref:Uncharacterized protein n=1 Tax=Leucogyrophana mollusca TaxID=85980 RepID=A0ACB8BW08_9AGAM|nr:hypothetical protein BV22DRAFT_76901 [Leucogyrophana mollusca]
MDSPPLAPLGTVGVDLAHQYESQFTGIVLATMLCGITIVQAWIYINDNRDSWIFRILVFILILADIATTVLDLKLMHRNLVQNFGNVEALAIAHLDIISEYGITVVIVFMVQFFLLSRVYLSKKEWWWMSAVTAVFSIGAFVTGIKAINDLSNDPQMAFLTSRDSEILFGISGGFSVVADILVTCGLTWLLATGQAEVKRCRTTLQKLLMYVVCRGLLVSVTQLLFFILYLAKPAALWCSTLSPWSHCSTRDPAAT